MTRIKSVHDAAMNSAFRTGMGAPDCAYCRRSVYDLASNAFLCREGKPQTDAASCPSWKDSRVQSSTPPDFLK